MTADILALPNADDVHSTYEEAAAAFRADPRAERIPAVLAAYRRFHRCFCPTLDTDEAVAGVRQLMWAEIAKRQDRGDAA